ncbi:MAG TPA: hypothetical protein DF984_04710 [Anaerolineaceae bacterium]|nr:hypothetical protein [Anaerolineaceae bacterium]
METNPPEKRSSKTFLIIAVVIVLISCCCLAAIGGVGYSLYANGQLTFNGGLSITGRGPGEIQIINLSDGPIKAQLDRIDDESGESYGQGTLDLAPYDIASFRSLYKDTYLLQISVPSGAPPDSTCTLKIKGGQVYRVVTVPEGTVIARDNNKVDSAEELDINTSSLCQP